MHGQLLVRRQILKQTDIEDIFGPFVSGFSAFAWDCRITWFFRQSGLAGGLVWLALA